MPHCDIVNQLLNEHGFTHARATKETNLTATAVGRKQVDHLNARNEDLGFGVLLGEGWRFAVDGLADGAGNLALAVDPLAQQVHDAPERSLANRHGHGAPKVVHLRSAHQTDG